MKWNEIGRNKMTLNGPAMKRNKIVKWNEMEYNGMKWNGNGMKME